MIGWVGELSSPLATETTRMKRTSIIIADGHFLTRYGLKQLFLRKPEIKLLAEAEDEAQLLALLNTLRPEIIMIDPTQESSFSIHSIDRIQKVAPSVKILVISANYDKPIVYRILEQGVFSYLTKICDDKEILESIESTAAGERFFCKKILNLIWEKSFGREDECNGALLTTRELEIVQYVVQGKITKEIAHELKLSIHTVFTHRKNILKKLDLKNTTELVSFALQNQLVETQFSLIGRNTNV